MKLTEKLSHLRNEHFEDWQKTKQQVESELSNRQSMFCCCGRLATGLHEYHCQRFRNKVISETIKRLKHLISNNLTTKK